MLAIDDSIIPLEARSGLVSMSGAPALKTNIIYELRNQYVTMAMELVVIDRKGFGTTIGDLKGKNRKRNPVSTRPPSFSKLKTPYSPTGSKPDLTDPECARRIFSPEITLFRCLKRANQRPRSKS